MLASGRASEQACETLDRIISAIVVIPVSMPRRSGSIIARDIRVLRGCKMNGAGVYIAKSKFSLVKFNMM